MGTLRLSYVSVIAQVGRRGQGNSRVNGARLKSASVDSPPKNFCAVLLCYVLMYPPSLQN